MIEIPYEIFEKIAKLKTRGQKIVAIGTTVCRTLESLPYLWKELQKEKIIDCSKETIIYWENITKPLKKESYISSLSFDEENKSILFSTEIYIYPGKNFFIIDDLITNFHLPESSLLMLV